MKLEFHHINFVSKNIEYSIFLSKIVNDFIKKNKIKKIDFVSSHGHTIFHQPERAYTLQIGNLINLKKLIKIPLICDFRTDDINTFIKRLKKEKIPFSDYGTTFAKEWHQIFFQDPEGNVVEVHQKIS